MPFPYDAFRIGKEVDLAVHVLYVKRQQVIVVGLAWHTIDRIVPHHLSHAVLEFEGMEVGRA
jgi:hypothetical protein